MKNPHDLSIDAGEGCLWDVKQVAKYLNLSQRAIYSLVSQRLIPFVKILNRYRFRPDEIRAYTRRLEVPEEGSPSTSTTEAHGG